MVVKEENTLPRVVVAGDVMLDRTVQTLVRGPSPENQNVLVVRAQSVAHNLGGAANVAHNLVTLGAEVTLYGRVGDKEDKDADTLTDLLHEAHIVHRFTECRGMLTPRKERIVSPDGQLLRVDYEADAVPPNHDVAQQMRQHQDYFEDLAEAAVVCLVNYDKGFFSGAGGVEYVVPTRPYSAAGKLAVLVDPGRRPRWSVFAGTNVTFKVNLHQAHDFLVAQGYESLAMAPGRKHAQPTHTVYAAYAVSLSRVMRSLFDFGRLWLTVGAGGMVLVASDGAVHTAQHLRPVVATDVCGAGDTAMAAYAHFVAQHGNNWHQACKALHYANVAAGLAVQKPGVVTLSPTELDTALRALATEAKEVSCANHPTVPAPASSQPGAAEASPGS